MVIGISMGWSFQRLRFFVCLGSRTKVDVIDYVLYRHFNSEGYRRQNQPKIDKSSFKPLIRVDVYNMAYDVLFFWHNNIITSHRVSHTNSYWFDALKTTKIKEKKAKQISRKRKNDSEKQDNRTGEWNTTHQIDCILYYL